MPHILIIEDEPNLASIISDYVTAAGFSTDIINDGAKVLTWLSNHHTDLILLDLMLPNIDGLTLCKQFQNTPFIITTAKVEEIDRLLGLELGADDYICKPYSPREVVARIKAVFRRMSSVVQNDDFLVLDQDRLTARFKEHEANLTLVEFRLLQALTENQGRILSRQQLMDRIYSDGRIVSDRTVDSHIKKLRKKINLLSQPTELIHSVYGAGYKYN